jgi:hypothetical protein
MSNNNIQYDDNFTCEKCGLEYVGKFYLLTTRDNETQVSSCTGCGNRNERPTVRKDWRPIFCAPLPFANPTTGKIGRSQWAGLPSDLVFILDFREKLELGLMDELEKLSKSPYLRNFQDDLDNYNVLVKSVNEAKNEEEN